MNQANQFIANEFARRKARNPQYSIRAFAKWLGLSPAQVSQVISGKRRVTASTFKILSERFAISPAQKRKLLDSILETSSSAEAVSRLKLSDDKFRLIADWYHLAILALTKLKDAKPDARWISNRLGISRETASQTVSRLVRLGLLRTSPTFAQVGQPFEIASDIPNEAIRKYHRQSLELAADSLEKVPNHLREFQSITIALNPNKIAELKKLIDEFMDEAADVVAEPHVTEVYSLNVQLFPITKSKSNRVAQEKKS